MKRTTLTLNALALSLGLTLSPFSATTAETSSATAAQQTSDLTPILEKVMPSVVSISVEGSTTVNTPRMPCNFQQFFGDDSPFCQEGPPFQSSPFYQGGLGSNGGDQQQKFMALGSDVIIDADKGYVIANSHVVGNAVVIRVQLSDGRKSDAKMVGKDPRSDTVLIQTRNPKNPTAIKMVDSDTLYVGDYTVAIGSPFGLGETVASGIVSALEYSGLSAGNCKNFIQTDAAINRGNSGGALVNLNDELIGINAAIFASDGGGIDIGFAIPDSVVKNLTSQMVEYGQVKRGELGVMDTKLNFDLAKAMGIDVQHGVLVSQVLPNSPAVKAGTKADNVIASLNGKPISSFTALRAQVGTMSVGGKLTLGLLRDGKQANVNLEPQWSNQNQVDSGTIFNGIEGAEVSSKGKDQGVVVNNMKVGTSAAQIGLKKGDAIIGANQQTVKNIAELRRVPDSRPSALALNTQCGGSTIYLLMQ